MTRLAYRFFAAGSALALLGLGGQALASGFESPAQSARGLGSAGSDGAADQGLDFLWSNPAAIADVDGRVFYVAGSLAAPVARASNDGSSITRPLQPAGPVGGKSPTDPVGVAAMPSLGVAWGVTKQLSAGLSLAAPYGFDLTSPASSWTRYQGVDVRFLDADTQATIAWRQSDQFSAGFGVDAAYGRVRLKSALPNLSALLPDGRSDFSGDGWDFGWVAGAQWRPISGLSFGASYRSGVDHSLEGRLITRDLLGPLAVGDGRLRASGKLKTPAAALLGVRWRAIPAVTLTAQAAWSGWSRFTTIGVVYPGAPAQPKTATRDTTAVSVGAEYAATLRLTLRAGVQTDPQAIAGSALLTDGDRHLYGLGASYALGGTATLDVALGWLKFKTARIAADATAYGGTPLATPIRLQGDLAARAGLISVGLRSGF